MTSFAQIPPIGSIAYQHWKLSLIAPGGPSVPTSANSINQAASGTTICYISPDASYTTIPQNDDSSVHVVNLPFSFCLYNATYSSCYINNNGTITFAAPNSQFTSNFPTTTAMIAPFWADVWTMNGNTVKYKKEAHRLIVTWPGVGYFLSCGLKNTFQCILTDGTAAGGIGVGNNVAFYYGDMQWTTGEASGGTGGFGGMPATVGISKGDGVTFTQIGLFNLNNSNYDGSGANNDGVNYLDYECFTFNTCSVNN